MLKCEFPSRQGNVPKLDMHSKCEFLGVFKGNGMMYSKGGLPYHTTVSTQLDI